MVLLYSIVINMVLGCLYSNSWPSFMMFIGNGYHLGQDVDLIHVRVSTRKHLTKLWHISLPMVIILVKMLISFMLEFPHVSTWPSVGQDRHQHGVRVSIPKQLTKFHDVHCQWLSSWINRSNASRKCVNVGLVPVSEGRAAAAWGEVRNLYRLDPLV